MDAECAGCFFYAMCCNIEKQHPVVDYCSELEQRLHNERNKMIERVREVRKWNQVRGPLAKT